MKAITIPENENTELRKKNSLFLLKGCYHYYAKKIFEIDYAITKFTLYKQRKIFFSFCKVNMFHANSLEFIRKQIHTLQLILCL